MQKETWIKTTDGLSLYGVINLPQQPKGIVVVVHGLAEHLYRYNYLADFLKSAGYIVLRYDQRGHGKSDKKNGIPVFLGDYNELADDVNSAVQLMKQDYPNLPIFVIGHSMGGFSVVAFGTKYPHQVNGIVTSGALTRLNNPDIASIPEGTPPETILPNELSDGVCSDPDVIEAYVQDPMVPKEITASIFIELTKGTDFLKMNAASLVEPILILHGQNDALVAEKDSRDLYGEVGSEDKQLIIYPKLFHEIFNEPVKYSIYQTVVDWLDGHLD